MTDVFDRIKAANPVPDPDRYYESVTGDGRQLLGPIRDRRNHMTVDEITRLETPKDPPRAAGFRGWKVAVTAAAAVVALVVGFSAVGGGSDEVAGSSNLEIEEEIIALIEDWMDVWTTGDGQAAVDLFTADGRYVSGFTGIDGWSGDELKAGIEREGSAANQPVIVGSPLIIERDDHYQVALIWRPNSVGGGDDNFFSMANIVEENGSLKIRYAEFWAPLGWFQLADGLPYQMVNQVR